jgi:hypothetical protein
MRTKGRITSVAIRALKYTIFSSKRMKLEANEGKKQRNE